MFCTKLIDNASLTLKYFETIQQKFQFIDSKQRDSLKSF